jgi:hypothetical protein
MTALDLFRNFQEIGARFELISDGFDVFAPRGTISPEMLKILKVHKDEIVNLLRQSELDQTELNWRIEAMRPQLPEPGKPFPYLYAKQDINPTLGHCFSCGERLKEFESGYCCGLCSRAKHIVLEL